MGRGCLSAKPPTFKPPVKKVTINQGVRYIQAIIDTFPDNPEMYQIFVGIMCDFKSKRIDIDSLVFLISMLFEENKKLLRGFNKFLPNGKKTLQIKWVQKLELGLIADWSNIHPNRTIHIRSRGRPLLPRLAPPPPPTPTTRSLISCRGFLVPSSQHRLHQWPTLPATPASRFQICSSSRCELEEPLVSRQRASEHNFILSLKENLCSRYSKKPQTGIMAVTQLGCHTIGSHGIKVARFHLYDWIILIFLAVVYGLFNIIEPFHRFVGRDMLTDLSYPLKSNTVPFWAVPLIAIVLPWVIFGGIYFKNKNVYDLHHGILGILYSVLITAVITDAIKNGVGRPRPDFFWRCFPDGKPNFDNVTGDVICHGERSVIKEGYKSFPSGHSSGAFAGLGFLAWYLAGKLKAFNREGHIAKLCLVFLPLLVASLVAVSRVDDYWHHWQDVFAGGIIGLTVASFCYLQFFPCPFDADAIWPHAYFQQLAESQSNGNANSHNMGWSETEAFHEDHDHGAIVLSDAGPILDSMESGRRL